LLLLIKESGMFSLVELKRRMRSFIASRPELERPELGVSKPDGTFIKEMYSKRMCGHGVKALSEEDNILKPKVMGHLHTLSCATCGPRGEVGPDCYFVTMLKCIENGWKPEVKEDAIVPLYEVTENYKSLDLYSVSTTKEFSKMMMHGVVEETSNVTKGIWHPMGAVIKNSDKRKALVLCKVKIINQKSMEEASSVLEHLGFPALKARITHDCTASGLNRAAWCPPFRYPSLAEGIKLVSKGCWLAKGDVSRYFHSFPIAAESRRLFLLKFGDKCYRAKRCIFGIDSG